MLKTEDEARQCWCPFVRQQTTINNKYGDATAIASLNASDHTLDRYDVAPCIASDCMAWRWRNKHSLMFRDWRDDSDDLQGDAAQRENYEGDQPTGYCGLAGKPEAA